MFVECWCLDQLQCLMLCMSNKVFLLLKELILELTTQFCMLTKSNDYRAFYIFFVVVKLTSESMRKLLLSLKKIETVIRKKTIFFSILPTLTSVSPQENVSLNWSHLSPELLTTSNLCFNKAQWPSVSPKDILISTMSTFHVSVPLTIESLIAEYILIFNFFTTQGWCVLFSVPCDFYILTSYPSFFSVLISSKANVHSRESHLSFSAGSEQTCSHSPCELIWP